MRKHSPVNPSHPLFCQGVWKQSGSVTFYNHCPNPKNLCYFLHQTIKHCLPQTKRAEVTIRPTSGGYKHGAHFLTVPFYLLLENNPSIITIIIITFLLLLHTNPTLHSITPPLDFLMNTKKAAVGSLFGVIIPTDYNVEPVVFVVAPAPALFQVAHYYFFLNGKLVFIITTTLVAFVELVCVELAVIRGQQQQVPAIALVKQVVQFKSISTSSLPPSTVLLAQGENEGGM